MPPEGLPARPPPARAKSRGPPPPLFGEGRIEPLDFPERFLLGLAKFADAFPREAEEVEELVLGEGRFFGRALDLDDAAFAGEHEIRVGVGGAVLGVVEIEHGAAFVDAAGNRGDLPREWDALDLALFHQPFE